MKPAEKLSFLMNNNEIINFYIFFFIMKNYFFDPILFKLIFSKIHLQSNSIFILHRTQLLITYNCIMSYHAVRVTPVLKLIIISF